MPEKYRTTISTIGGQVFISLPDDQYIEMTPEQARQIGGRLFLKAAAALGEPAPSMVILDVTA